MDNFLVSVKKFFSNKNTVTIIGVLVGIGVLYAGYTIRVKQAVTLVKVPVATQELAPRTLIKREMVTTIEVPQSLVSKSANIITNTALVIGKYVSYGTTIPANSMFYKTTVMAADEMPDSAFANIPDGYTIYSLGVDLHTTYGNSIFPGNAIDLYMKAVDENGLIVYGKLIERIEVNAVKDSSGKHVFESTVENRVPAELLFAVPDDMYLLLMKASYITGSGIEIRPVPRNANYVPEEGATKVSSDWLKQFILAKTTYIPENVTVTGKCSVESTVNTTQELCTSAGGVWTAGQ